MVEREQRVKRQFEISDELAESAHKVLQELDRRVLLKDIVFPSRAYKFSPLANWSNFVFQQDIRALPAFFSVLRIVYKAQKLRLSREPAIEDILPLKESDLIKLPKIGAKRARFIRIIFRGKYSKGRREN